MASSEVNVMTDKKAVLSQEKLCDAAVVIFCLKFANKIHYKFKSIAKLRKPGFRAPNIPAKNRMQRKMAIQGHSKSCVLESAERR